MGLSRMGLSRMGLSRTSAGSRALDAGKPSVTKKAESIASRLRVLEWVMLFCLASGTDWERAYVTHATAQ
jgi:hypothetical protein